jgi:hypothetical protein
MAISQIVFVIYTYIFIPNLIFLLKLCANFQNPRTTPSGTKVCGMERKKGKKNNHKNSGHYVLLQSLRAAHAFRMQSIRRARMSFCPQNPQTVNKRHTHYNDTVHPALLFIKEEETNSLTKMLSTHYKISTLFLPIKIVSTAGIPFEYSNSVARYSTMNIYFVASNQ